MKEDNQMKLFTPLTNSLLAITGALVAIYFINIRLQNIELAIQKLEQPTNKPIQWKTSKFKEC